MLSILLTSPVRIIWFAAEIWGLRLRAKIMNAFMGRLGVPSALSVWDEVTLMAGKAKDRSFAVSSISAYFSGVAMGMARSPPDQT